MGSLLQNDFLLAVLAFALVLIPAIVIHEFGHFLAARAIGVNVLEFGVGFPPRIARLFMWGETEFTLNWLPIGGFVRPLGEDFIGPVDTHGNKAKGEPTPYMSERDELRARGVPESKMLSVNEAKPLPRIFFMVAGALANFVSAAVVFVIIALIGLPEAIGARAQLIGLPEGEDRFALNDAIERVNGQLFTSMGDFLRLWIAQKDQPTELTLRSFESNEVYTVSLTPHTSEVEAQVVVMSVSSGSPADIAGLRLDDAIVAVNGQPFSLDDVPVVVLQQATSQSIGKPIALRVRRGSELLDVSLVPRENPPAGQGRIGISIASRFITDDGLQFGMTNPQEQLVPQSLPNALAYGVTRTWNKLVLIASIPAQLIQGTISPEEARPVSIVGISQVGGQFLRQSVEEGTPILILNFFALISLFLGFTNLLPLPPLDGGRVVFIVIEMVRGKPVPFHIENLVYRVGITFLLSLGLIVILYDMLNPFVLVR